MMIPNVVRDYTMAQGYTHPTDSHVIPRRDLNVRYVTLENSSSRPIGIAITTYCCGPPIPKLQFVLGPGEIKHLGINTHGEPMQYIHMLDPETKLPVGSPKDLQTNANQFVLRDGLQNWYIQPFKRAIYSA
jgi:hypothetical protein